MKRPYWFPDTRGFLAIAIILGVLILALLLMLPGIKFDDKVAGAFMTLLGVLIGCLKDTYSYYFSSTENSKAKDATILQLAGPPAPLQLPPPVPQGAPMPATPAPRRDAITGAVLSTILLAILLWPAQSFAQVPKPADLYAKIIADSAAALADAEAHQDVIAANCYKAINTEATARQQAASVTGGGALLLFQKVRDVARLNATPQGTNLIVGCAALVQDARLNMLQFFTNVGATVMLKGLLIP